MKSFAAIHIPQLGKTFFYEESEERESTMYIENFLADRRLSYTLSAKNYFPNFPLETSNFKSISREIYQEWVEFCIQNIQDEEYTKLVAAQCQKEEYPEPIPDWHLLFQNLITHLPNTFVYLFYIDGHIWLGASPELVGICENGVFKTISLAGTKSEEAFTTKEVDEQSIVSHFITSQFDPSKELNDSTTRVLPFGSIHHLVNEYAYAIDASFDFEKAIHDIHPSPALSGMPKEKSIEFIHKHEPIQREFYSGLVSISIENKNYSFATIRCARFSTNQIVYYAGAGITKDSNAPSEWEETMHKIRVLRDSLFSS